MDFTNEFEIVTKKLFVSILDEKDLPNRLNFYVTVHNLQKFLNRISKMPDNYSEQLLIEFATDQKVTLDYNAFKEFLQNMMRNAFPIIKDMFFNFEIMSIGDSFLMEKILIDLLFCKDLIINDKKLGDLTSQRLYRFSIDYLFDEDQIKDFDDNFNHYQQKLVALLNEIPNIMNNVQEENYSSNLKLMMGLFCASKTPIKYYRCKQLARLVFDEFLKKRLLDYFMNMFGKYGEGKVFEDVLGIFLLFLNLFKYNDNFAYYNNSIANSNLDSAYLQNMITSLILHNKQNLFDNYYKINVKSFNFLIGIVE